MENRVFTISTPSEAYLIKADHFGTAGGRDEDKFCLTPVRSKLVPAPYVGEFPVVLECKLLHNFEIGLHTL